MREYQPAVPSVGSVTLVAAGGAGANRGTRLRMFAGRWDRAIARAAGLASVMVGALGVTATDALGGSSAGFPLPQQPATTVIRTAAVSAFTRMRAPSR